MFGKWRIREHMEVMGCDGRRLGTVDRVSGDLIRLTKSDPGDSLQHVVSADRIDRVKNNRLYIKVDDAQFVAP